MTSNYLIQPQDPGTSAQELQRATRDLREQIRQSVQRELQVERAGRAATPPTAPTAPIPPTTYVSVPPFRFGPRDEIPPQAVDISIAFFITVAAIIIGLPLARAFARRMDRRGGAANIPGEVTAQLSQLNQAVDAIALEVERISEGQRFTTRLLSEQRDAATHSLPSGSGR